MVHLCWLCEPLLCGGLTTLDDLVGVAGLQSFVARPSLMWRLLAVSGWTLGCPRASTDPLLGVAMFRVGWLQVLGVLDLTLAC